jgi:menaquinol-cytochrome c reductase iron-sulfur subunit
LVAGVPVVGSIVGPLLKRVPSPWRVVGTLEEFAIGETVRVVFEDASSVPWSGVTARSAAWLRREDAQTFVAFSVNCRHLGCPVRWVPDAELFMCPCHGGVYYKDGSVAAGPPPKPLHRYPVRVHEGQVEIRAEPIPLTT